MASKLPTDGVMGVNDRWPYPAERDGARSLNGCAEAYETISTGLFLPLLIHELLLLIPAKQFPDSRFQVGASLTTLCATTWGSS